MLICTAYTYKSCMIPKEHFIIMFSYNLPQYTSIYSRAYGRIYMVRGVHISLYMAKAIWISVHLYVMGDWGSTCI